MDFRCIDSQDWKSLVSSNPSPFQQLQSLTPYLGNGASGLLLNNSRDLVVTTSKIGFSITLTIGIVIYFDIGVILLKLLSCGLENQNLPSSSKVCFLSFINILPEYGIRTEHNTIKL